MPVSVNLQVNTGGLLLLYEVATAGLRVTPGLGSGNLFGDATVGMGTDAIGNWRSIESGSPNESIVFEIFRSNGVVLGAPDGATGMTLSLGGVGTTTFDLHAEDKDGGDLGSVTTSIGTGTVDVGGLFPGEEIHKLTIEATSLRIRLLGIDYVHVCLGYDPAP
jgi:hypothetical protein